MAGEKKSAEVIRKQWVILFAQRRMQRELPPQTDETGGGKKKERVERENMI